MASYVASRRYSTSRASTVKDAEFEGFRRKRPTDERDRRRSSAPRKEVETVYIYKHVDAPKRRTEDPKQHRLRRSSDTVARHKFEADRRRPEEVDLTRRSTRRRGHHHDDDFKRSQTEQRPRSSGFNQNSRPVRRSSSARHRSPPAAPTPVQRSKTSVQRPRAVSDVPPAPDPPRVEPYQRTPFRRKPDRPASIISSIFGPSKAHSKPPSVVAPKPPKPPKPVKPPPIVPEKRVECLTCLSDVPLSRSAKLACQHRMCHSCLRRIFTLSVTDPQHMPPKCCTNDHIPLKHVDRLFDLKFKKTWNRKYQEYTTKNRIYCPARGCGEWIKPAHIHTDTSGGASGGRKYGRCTRCRTKVCCTCNGRWHHGRECPRDEATARFAEIAKKEGWQRCFNCSAMVELREGCNHMTCRCRAEFCMICGAEWKSCDCPWFNYEAVENDRLNHMQVPEAVPMQPPQPQGRQANPALGYQQEMERRRAQERADEAFARRLQGMGLDGADDYPDPVPPREPINVNEYLVHPAPHLAPDFIRRAQDILAATYNPAQANRAANDILNNMPRPQAAPVSHARAPPAEAQPMLRQHTAASRAHNTQTATRASERVVPRRTANDYQSERVRHQPLGRSTGEPRHSILAGLTSGTAEGRVDTWRRHVEV